MFKVVYKYGDGTTNDVEESDGSISTFKSRAEASDYAGEVENNMATGREVFHLSNPGDYPEDEGADTQVGVVEIDD